MASTGSTSGPQVTIRDEDFENGVVKFKHSDGYGFITREGKPDAYFHVDRIDPAIRNKVVAGASVSVAVGSGKRSPIVLALRIIS